VIYQVHAHHKLETSPLVFDGIMYITEPPSDVTALDLRTGRRIWSYRRTMPNVPVCCGQVNRGLAALDDQLFVGTLDAHLVALDMKTGRVRWDVEVADYKTAHSITLAPLAVKDKVIVGIAGAEYGIRGFLDAYEPKSGKRAWRFWTVPGPGEPGNETWGGDSWKTGGAPTWVTGAYDPEANLIYWGTGNPGPDYAGDVRKGDNLYSDCLIAINADTGKLQWHFQFIPHDVNDIDANEIPVLVDGVFRGKPRKLVLFANRNGFYYILDRITGEFLLGHNSPRRPGRRGWTNAAARFRILPPSRALKERRYIQTMTERPIGTARLIVRKLGCSIKTRASRAPSTISLKRRTCRASNSWERAAAGFRVPSHGARCARSTGMTGEKKWSSGCNLRRGLGCSPRAAAWCFRATWKATFSRWMPLTGSCSGVSRQAGRCTQIPSLT